MPIGEYLRSDEGKDMAFGLGMRMLAAAQGGQDPRQAGLGAALRGFMSDMPGIQENARRRRQEQIKEEERQRDLDRQAKTTEAIKKHTEKAGKEGTTPDYRAIARDMMEHNPELAAKFIGMAPKALKGKDRYMQTDAGWLDTGPYGQQAPTMVPGSEAWTSQDDKTPSRIREARTMAKHMRSLDPKLGKDEAMMRAYSMAGSQKGKPEGQLLAGQFQKYFDLFIEQGMTPEMARIKALTLAKDVGNRFMGGQGMGMPMGQGGIGTGGAPVPAPAIPVPPAAAAPAPAPAPAPAAAPAPASPPPAGQPTAQDYYAYLKKKYPNRSDDVIRARVAEKFGR